VAGNGATGSWGQPKKINIERKMGNHMKTSFRITIIVSFMFLLIGCATTYGPKELAGGYAEEMLTPNTMRVMFEGNQYNDQEEIKTYLMYRCAELTLDKGFTHFLILEDASFQDVVDQEFDASDIKFETRTSMSGGVQSTVSSTFGPQETSGGTIGVFDIFMRVGPDPSYPSASLDAKSIIESNKADVKFRK
jgi:hypothetical protein